MNTVQFAAAKYNYITDARQWRVDEIFGAVCIKSSPTCPPIGCCSANGKSYSGAAAESFCANL